jgi:hypothetical protein
MTIGAFATDGDPGYDKLHEAQSERNMAAFLDYGRWVIPLTQHFRPISDILHLLKRARYRMLKKIWMVLGTSDD